MVNAILDMFGTIDDAFGTVVSTRTPIIAGYADGLPSVTYGVPTQHKVTIQPLSDRDINSLDMGGERVIDMRKIYVNDGDLYSIRPADEWIFTGIDGTFKSIQSDLRPWRNYAKIIVSRTDDS